MNKPKIAVVGIPGKWSTEKLADEVEAKTGFRLVVDMSKVTLDLSTNSLWFGNVNLCQLDGVLVKKISAKYSPNTLDRLELLRIAEAQGVKVFSGAENMVRLVDRLSCTVTLQNGDIPMPETCVTEDLDAALVAVERFGEAIFKPLYSTKAQGMCVISSHQSKMQIVKEIEAFRTDNPMMYIQRKLNLLGQDLGLVFLGGVYLGTYARVSKNDAWNTTINSGGHYAAYQPSDDIIAMAKKAQALFNLDFTTVDVAETPEGPIVFEVSAFGGFRGALEGANLDAAALYVDYALNKLRQ